MLTFYAVEGKNVTSGAGEEIHLGNWNTDDMMKLLTNLVI